MSIDFNNLELWKVIIALIGVIVVFLPNLILSVSFYPFHVLPECDKWGDVTEASGQTWAIHIVVMLIAFGSALYGGLLNKDA